MDNFIYYALAAGIGIALPAGALGCFIVWRRLAYFSDSLSHSALLGIAHHHKHQREKEGAHG